MTRKASDKETSAPESAQKPPRRLPLPSDNPTTNLVIADIVLLGASTLLRQKVERQVVKASAHSSEEERKVLDGRSMLTTLGLYGASRLATRSVPGLALVTGGLVLKTLYDRGKAVRRRKGRQRPTSQGAETGADKDT
ncbi:MAG: hypothetical protein ACMUJI_06550 [Erythrobacter sp.]|uniref:hypothetical protein n=1 Tax=Erythrobacter sp. TaxID=1042 RepID=UPI003A863767